MADLEKAALIEQLLDEILSDEAEYFKVKFKVKPTNNFKIYIDGDNGITIDKCIKINRALYKKIEEQELYPEGDFSLEVSSPGVDEPLVNIRQYKKNIGRKVEVLFNDETNKVGKLLEVNETGIIVEHTTGKGKSLVTEQLNCSFDNIKSTIVQIQF